MDNHLMLDKINYENGTIMLEGKEYKLKRHKLSYYQSRKSV